MLFLFVFCVTFEEEGDLCPLTVAGVSLAVGEDGLCCVDEKGLYGVGDDDRFFVGEVGRFTRVAEGGRDFFGEEGRFVVGKDGIFLVGDGDMSLLMGLNDWFLSDEDVFSLFMEPKGPCLGEDFLFPLLWFEVFLFAVGADNIFFVLVDFDFFFGPTSCR